MSNTETSLHVYQTIKAQLGGVGKRGENASPVCFVPKNSFFTTDLKRGQ